MTSNRETKSLASSDSPLKVSASKSQLQFTMKFMVSASVSPRNGDKPLSLQRRERTMSGVSCSVCRTLVVLHARCVARLVSHTLGESHAWCVTCSVCHTLSVSRALLLLLLHCQWFHVFTWRRQTGEGHSEQPITYHPFRISRGSGEWSLTQCVQLSSVYLLFLLSFLFFWDSVFLVNPCYSVTH